ncbi:MAG: hypothetical protein J5662_01165 [Clostridia bacterium]|nr:hypothetical protein [Clostridia bacterium]
MYYCTDCDIFIEDPKLKNFKIAGKKEKRALCPVCGGELTVAQPEYCRYCGRKLTSDSPDAYCNDNCRRLGRKLWTREIIRRRKIKEDPIARILRMLTSYNREHNTKYSYGQFVSLILPKIEKRGRRAKANSYGC